MAKPPKEHLYHATGGMYDEPDNLPGVAQIVNDGEQTELGQRNSQTWLHSPEPSEFDGLNTSADVAVSTVTWVSFTALTVAIIAALAKMAMVLGVSAIAVQVALVLTALIAYGMFMWTFGRMSQRNFWRCFISVVVGVILGLL